MSWFKRRNSKRTDKCNKRHDFHNKNKYWNTDKCENRRNGHCLGVGGRFIKVTQEEIEDQNAPKTTKEVESVS